MVQQRMANTLHRLQSSLRFFGGSRATPHNSTNRLPVQVLREGWRWRDDEEGKEPAHIFRCCLNEIAISPQHSRGLTHVPERWTKLDDVHRMELELKRRDHAEVASATAHRPEQVGVLLRIRRHEAPVDQNHVNLK